MNNKTFKYIRQLLIVVIISSILAILYAIYGNDIRYGDKGFEEMLENTLSQQRIVLNDVLPKGDTICVIPPYSTTRGLVTHNADEQAQLDYAENIIHDDLDDDHWWLLVSTKGQAIPKLLKISGKSRPNFKQAKCLPRNVSRFSLKKENIYIYFNIYIK